MNLEILQKNIGKCYSEVSMGCVNTLYMIYSDIPAYEFNLDPDYFLPLVEKYFKEIKSGSRGELADLDFVQNRQATLNDADVGVFEKNSTGGKENNQKLKNGDLLILKVRNDWHFAIFKEPNLIYHCTEKSKLRLSKLEFYKKYVVKKYRRKGEV